LLVTQHLARDPTHRRHVLLLGLTGTPLFLLAACSNQRSPARRRCHQQARRGGTRPNGNGYLAACR
jgi:hypothetical protein